MEKLRLTEIFFSLQGEARTVGLPTVFIRLTGCPLRCQYCDTAYAFQGGTWFTLDQILAEVKKYSTKFVTVTGGEPLAQKSCWTLLARLCDEGYEVSLETSGAIEVDKVDARVIKVIDIKTPGSMEVTKNKWDNLKCVTKQDQVKFVICDEADYVWAKQILLDYDLPMRTEVLFSASHKQLPSQNLADWIVKDQLNVRFQLQLHKYLWNDAPGH